MVVWVRLVGVGGVSVSCGENCRPGLYFCNQTSVFLCNSAGISLSENVWHHFLRARKLKNVVMLVTCIRKVTRLNLV